MHALRITLAELIKWNEGDGKTLNTEEKL